MRQNLHIKWKKIGLIFNPNKSHSWMQTHAALPTADHIKNDLYKIYFSTRDSTNRASVAYVIIDIKNPKQILQISNQPVLRPGKFGTFDENGVMAHSIVNFKGKKYMYYTGWNLRSTVPFHWSIGLAVSSDGGKTFTRYSDGPLLDRDIIDPLFVASPTVLLENKKWKMWYLSGTSWKGKNPPKISYHIRYAESNNGINWKRNGHIAINLEKNESRIARPAILKEKGYYRMWYSYAKKSYRIGYAESIDGYKWKRKDDLAGINISKSGWDSEMIEYPFVFVHNSVKYLLYNGNEYGKTGFGLAISN